MKNIISSLMSVVLIISIGVSVYFIYQVEQDKYNRTASLNLEKDHIKATPIEKTPSNSPKPSNNPKPSNSPKPTNTPSNKPSVEKTPLVIKVESIKINDNLNIYVGDKYTLHPTINPTNATDTKVTWSSSNEKIATVNQSGLITGISKGTAIITVKTSNNKESRCTVVVSDKISNNKTIDVKNISLNKSGETLNVGKTSQLTANVSPSNATNKNITWTSSNNVVATISTNGLVTAKSEGVATITAVNGNVKATYSLTVIATTTGEYCDNLHNISMKSLDYKLFKNKFPNSDDYYAIKATHDCANKYNLPVEVSKDTYNIYNKSEGTINVRTDTNLNNSTIYIHDENGVVGLIKTNHIYTITNDTCYAKTLSFSNLKYNNVVSSLGGSSNGRYVRVLDSSQKKFIRYGTNQDNGSDTVDSFRVDKDGKVLDQLFWNYDNRNVSVYMCDIPSKTLSFQNANIYNIIDTKTSNSVVSSTNSIYLRRGIGIKRSNVSINNINHYYVNSSIKYVYASNHGYYGFFNVENAANVTLNNLRVHSIKNNNKNVNSTYDIIIDHAANIMVKNVKMFDYDGSSGYFSRSSSQMKDDIWGVTGTNNVKNITYDNCVLNRIDTHKGVYNITIKNTKIGRHGINAIGMGNLKIDNVDMYYRNYFINLRSDYGSLWNGTISVSNSKIHPYNGNNVYLVDFRLSYDNNYLHNFGYDLYLPNINVGNFKVDSDISRLYIFNNSESNTGLVEGNLRNVQKYIKNNQFKYYYPKKSNIRVSNITDRGNAISSQNYYIDFGEN